MPALYFAKVVKLLLIFVKFSVFSSTKNRVVGFEVLSDLLGCTSALSNEA